MDRRIRIGIVALIIFVFLLSIHDIEARKLIQTEDITRVNKIRYNDEYDCVDFYKQPAFNHPLLANHTFHPEMRPSPTPKMTRSETNLLGNNMEIQYKAKGCPVGTVPIRRVTENDRIREKSLVKKYRSNYNVQDANRPGTHYAVVRTRQDPTKRYKGGAAGLSIWNLAVQNSQYSSGQIVIHNGNNNIQVGWTINPTMYGDNRTHLFIYTGAGTTQCFNTYCPGFVITTRDFAIDDVFDNVSTRGGIVHYQQFMIKKEESDGHWWLKMGVNFDPIGFWPKNIFTDLADAATSIEWGGQVHSPPNVPSPPMGSGKFLEEDPFLDAYCRSVTIINEANVIINATDIETISDTSRYKVIHEGIIGGNYGSLVYFGGPGGLTGD